VAQDVEGERFLAAIDDQYSLDAGFPVEAGAIDGVLDDRARAHDFERHVGGADELARIIITQQGGAARSSVSVATNMNSGCVDSLTSGLESSIPSDTGKAEALRFDQVRQHACDLELALVMAKSLNWGCPPRICRPDRRPAHVREVVRGDPVTKRLVIVTVPESSMSAITMDSYAVL